MVEVNGRAIVDHLIDGLADHGVRELLVVTGYREERLRAHLGSARGSLEISYVASPDFASTNNIVSLHRARGQIRPPFYLLESDVWAPAELIGRLARPDSVAVSTYTAEMDGTGVVVGPRGVVKEMVLRAHQLKERPQGLMKTVNFYSISSQLWTDSFGPGIAAAVNRGETNAYYEAVLAASLSRGEAEMHAVDATDLGWVEIDDLNDLARAEALVAGEASAADGPA